MMAEAEKWQWQEPGTAWKGAALYHVTLTVTDRQTVLGRLDVPKMPQGQANDINQSNRTRNRNVIAIWQSEEK